MQKHLVLKKLKKAAKDAIYKLREQTFLGKIANGITDIKKAAKEKIKSGLKKGFGAFAFGALAIAAIAFLNSPIFSRMVKYINKELIPAITVKFMMPSLDQRVDF